MKKIAIDIGSLEGGHSVRGIGVHTRELVEHLKKLNDKSIEISGINFAVEDLSKYDLVHYTSFHPHFLTLPSRKLVRNVIVTIHDLIPLIYPDHYPSGIKGKLRFLEQKRRLRNVDLIMTISETSKKDICRFLRINPNQVVVIHLAPKEIYRKLSDGNWKEKITKKYDLPKQFVLYVGDVNYNKNIPNIIRACKILKIPLVIVGKSALKIEELANSAHSEHSHLKIIITNLRSRGVKRLGFVPDEDLTAIYNLADIYCQPSFYEGFGLPLLEAMACGCPVVASEIQAHVEIADPAAVFFDPNDPYDMAKKIKSVIGSTKLKSQLASTGEIVLKNFSWKKTATQTLNVYKQLLNR